MSDSARGTVTFLFTDIEGSTNLVSALRDRWPAVLEEHNDLIRQALGAHHGSEMDSAGDGFFYVFQSAQEAVEAAVDAQAAMAAHAWPSDGQVRVRMGLHTGEAQTGASGYTGIDVHRAARIGAAGHGGQVLLSHTTHGLVADSLPAGVALVDLGKHRLKDLPKPEHLFQVTADGMRSDFPALRSLDTLPNNLPRVLTTFVGRDSETEQVRALLAGSPLLTLTGSGGIGKTRLALHVAADMLDAIDAFTRDPECLPAGGDDPHVGTGSQERVGESGAGIDEVLAIVEDEEGRLRTEMTDDASSRATRSGPGRSMRKASTTCDPHPIGAGSPSH